MSTSPMQDKLTTTLFSKTRGRVLALLYGHVDEQFYFRQIVRITGLGVGALQRELKTLTEAGIITKSTHGSQVYYQASSNCPVFTELKNLVQKTVGVGVALKTCLKSLADQIDLAFIFGSLANSSETRQSDVDIMVIGDVPFADLVRVLHQAQDTLRREINPIVYPLEEFRRKLAAEQHFLKNIMTNDKLFLIGTEDELARLAT